MKSAFFLILLVSSALSSSALAITADEAERFYREKLNNNRVFIDRDLDGPELICAVQQLEAFSTTNAALRGRLPSVIRARKGGATEIDLMFVANDPKTRRQFAMTVPEARRTPPFVVKTDDDGSQALHEVLAQHSIDVTPIVKFAMISIDPRTPYRRDGWIYAVPKITGIHKLSEAFQEIESVEREKVERLSRGVHTVETTHYGLREITADPIPAVPALALGTGTEKGICNLVDATKLSELAQQNDLVRAVEANGEAASR